MGNMCTRDMMRKIDRPILVLLAGHDEIVDNKKIEEWFNRLYSDDKTIKTFSDFHHVMPFEDNRRIITDFIISWTKSREASSEEQYIKN